jgi:carbon storage regulator CsrA
MLVVTRRSGECLRIGDDIKIKIKKVDGDSATFEIIMPPQVSITRSELFKRIIYHNERDLK